MSISPQQSRNEWQAASQKQFPTLQLIIQHSVNPAATQEPVSVNVAAESKEKERENLKRDITCHQSK